MSLPTLYQDVIAISRYARFRPDLGRREVWGESVARWGQFWRDRLGAVVEEETFDEVEAAILALEVMPSMRTMMTAGPALARDEVAGYNCAYTPVADMGPEIALWDSRLSEYGYDKPLMVMLRSPIVFDCVLYVLMCGTGMGFSVERQHINTLPTVGRKLPRECYKPTDANFPGVAREDLSFIDSNTIHVTDTKYGWASALRILIVELYNGNFEVSWDLSKIRPKGAPLLTFGGRASGPEPLERLFVFARELFKGANGRRLNSIECHDLVCMVADCVVSGGVRRSALISLSNLSDERMRHAKSGDWWRTNVQRQLANNSICYTEKPEVGVFMREWEALYESKSGERGIFNREAARRLCERIGRDPNHEWGCNPCCVTGDTMILTDQGHFSIETLVGKETIVWNGQEWSEVVPFSVGIHPTLVVSLSDGTEITCTPNHKFIVNVGEAQQAQTRRVEAQDLCVGMKLAKFQMPVIETGEEYPTDAYSQGFYSGDGNKDREFSWVYKEKYGCIERLVGTKTSPDKVYDRLRWKHGEMLPKTFVPINGSLSYCLNWLAGLLDSDGTVTSDKNGNGFQISSINKEFLLEVKLMLTRLGVRAKVVGGHNGGRRLIPDGCGGQNYYICQPLFRLLIGNQDTFHLGKLGLHTERLQWHNSPPQRDARRFVSVVSIVEGEEAETFCFDEPLNHTGTFNGIVTGQSEILLRPNQFCNLSEVVVRAGDDKRVLLHKASIAATIGTWQATLTNFKYLPPAWKEACEEERLLGVSLTGLMDHAELSVVSDASARMLQQMKEVVRETNARVAEQIGIGAAAATTCVKPSGTVSQLVNSASGLHPRYAPYYIRRVRMDEKDPLTQALIEAGFPCEPDVMGASRMVFSFPVEAPAGAVLRDDRTAIEQLQYWLHLQENWCEHKPSVTIYVREEEWMEVGAWVWKEFDKISGVSFLPHSDHTYQQAPYEEIDSETYASLVASMPDALPLAKLAALETSDMTTGSQEFACVGGACEL